MCKQKFVIQHLMAEVLSTLSPPIYGRVHKADVGIAPYDCVKFDHLLMKANSQNDCLSPDLSPMCRERCLPPPSKRILLSPIELTGTKYTD